MTEKIAMYAGSFDPVTNGHLDIIQRASKLVDKLIVAVMTNTSKKSMFTYEEREGFIQDLIKENDLKNVEVVNGENQLTVKLANSLNANFLIRAIRNGNDLISETEIQTVNKMQKNQLETVYLISDSKYAAISSSIIKETIKFNGDVTGLVSSQVENEIKKKMRE